MKSMPRLKTRIWCSLGAAGALLACCGTSAAKASWSGSQTEQVPDPKFGMTALTMDIPAGWKFAGSVVRPAGCHSAGANIAYTALGQDGVTALVALPGVTWSWSTSPDQQKYMADQHCPGIDINTPAAFLVNIVVPNLHPNGKIVSVLPLPPEGQAALAAQLKAQREQSAAMPNLKIQNQTLDGARVRVQYTRDGRPVEEMITAVVSCSDTPVPAMPMLKRAAAVRRTCASRGTGIVRAPQGELDGVLAQPAVKDLLKSVHPNPAWQTRLAQDTMAAFQQFEAQNNQQFQANQQHFREQNAQLMANGQAFRDNMRASTNAAMASDRARQNAIDQSAHAQVLDSLNRQDFKNPATGQTIEASNQYNHQWLSSDGSTLIQTNDHALDPNGQVYPVSQSWTELVPK
ncbi:MAG: hypothetical protein ABSH33_08655 [Steroidobacteraceae bacterium]